MIVFRQNEHQHDIQEHNRQSQSEQILPPNT
jgi:hypothetical protein